ncbi:hypothetical protein ABZ202_08785 [Streptomyces sp. NPDC006186]|uniref:hypothetical protein n=1 Tax=Streptomyces sp. NPDC006186 TaxID=3155248 RepID=UPI00339F6DAB
MTMRLPKPLSPCLAPAAALLLAAPPVASAAQPATPASAPAAQSALLSTTATRTAAYTTTRTAAGPAPAAQSALLSTTATRTAAHTTTRTAARPAPAPSEPDASCSGAEAAAGRFPLSARIVGGPASYEAGGGPGTWRIELRNTTARTCTGIHPVVVLVDSRHALTPAQARLEFSHGGREHTVPFEETDEDELVGAFTDEDGFHGFTVGPRGRLAVEVRLAFAADAVPDDVTVNAAVVQRHEDDGDWVGQSNDYRFTVREPSEEAPAEDVFPSEGRTETAPGTPSPDATAPGGTAPGGTAAPSPADPTASEAPAEALHGPGELAATGPLAHPVALASTALLLTGAALTVVRRPWRRR